MSAQGQAVRFDEEDTERISTGTRKLDTRLDEIGLTHERLHKTILELESRLAPILGVQPESKRTSEPQEAMESSLAGRLQELKNQAQGLIHTMQALMARIDL